LQHGLSGGSVIAEDPHLDQPVRSEGGVYLLLDSGAETVAPNEHDRVEMVRVGTVEFALGGSESDLGHGTIIV
jgi:hypothetical protein